MATLPPVKRFTSEDYAGTSSVTAFVEKFFYPLNLFLNSVYTALSNGLTLSANTTAVVKSLKVTTASTGIATTSINWPYPQTPPVGLAVLGCMTTTGISAGYPIPTWSYNAGVISISLQFVTVTAGDVVAGGADSYNVVFWASAG